jgi:hypothetical protein
MDDVIDREVHEIFNQIQWSNYNTTHGMVDQNEFYEVMKYSRIHLQVPESKNGPFSNDNLNAKFW